MIEPLAAAPRGPVERARDDAFRPGDPVLFLDAKQRPIVEVLRPRGRTDVRGRRLEHDALVGLPVGSSVEAATGERIRLLRATLADYALGMPRAATPTYPKDLGALLVHADVFPGATVLEAGTGSGALTLGLLRAVGPTGRVISYESRPQAQEKALENVRAWHGGLPPNLVARPREIYVSGVLEEDAPVDRVVLDLPEPWRVLPHLALALRPSGVLAAFTPGVNQMQELVKALVAASFAGIECMEMLHRRWHVTADRVRPEHRMVGHTGFLTFARRAVGKPDPREEAGANPDG